MKVRAQPRPQTIEQARAELGGRLEARREEIEAAVMTRVYSVSDTTDLDPTYAEGLKAAVTAAVDYGFAAIELGEERSPPPPPILLAQARMAARAEVSLDTVLRRYFAGHALLGDYLIEEAEGGRLLRGAALQRLLRTQAILFDRLLEAVSEEHTRETRERPGSSDQRRAERIERLLAGELVDISGLGYELDAQHLGAISSGPGTEEALRDLASALDRRLLMIRRDEEIVWAWFGGRRPMDIRELQQAASATWPAQIVLALGEPSEGIDGWRRTHRQAHAALPIALRGPESFVRYADVALLASMLQDDLLADSLLVLYLEPLEAERDGGEILRETLWAYFAAGRNVSSAAAALGVSRQAVAKRLRTYEERIDRQLDSCSLEIEAALRLSRLSSPAQAFAAASGR